MSSFWVRSVAEVYLYTGIGWVGLGEGGARFAFVGAVVLVVPFYALALVTDVPQLDRWNGTYSRVLFSRQPLVINYLARAVPQLFRAVLAAGVACVTVGLSLGFTRSVLALVPVLPLLAVCALSCACIGLLVVAPALGSRLDAMTYIIALALIFMTSGAIAPTDSSPLLGSIGNLLPLTHLVSAFRAFLAGGSPWPQVGLEAVVGLAWGTGAATFIAGMSARGCRTGRGNFAA